MTLLALERVTRRFGGLVAVDAVDLNVEQGGVTAIIGPNGAGKTTLFRTISGFQSPDEGRIIFAGEDITGSRRNGSPPRPRPHVPLVQLFPPHRGRDRHVAAICLHARVVTALVRQERAQPRRSLATARGLRGFVASAPGNSCLRLPYGSSALRSPAPWRKPSCSPRPAGALTAGSGCCRDIRTSWPKAHRAADRHD